MANLTNMLKAFYCWFVIKRIQCQRPVSSSDGGRRILRVFIDENLANQGSDAIIQNNQFV
jgi:hypothetical protein